MRWMPEPTDDEPAYGIFRPDPEYLEEVRTAAKRAIETAGPDFGKAITALETAVLRLPGPDLICRNALYYLTTFAGENPEQRGDGVFANHVELIQGLALRQTAEEMSPELSLQEGGDGVIDAAKAAMEAFMVLEMSKVERAREAEKAKVMALSEMRIYLASVRGQAYFDELVAVWRELFAPLDDGIHGTLGVRIGDLITWWESVASALEVRINDHFDRVRTAAELPVDDNWPAAVEERFPRVPIPFDDEVREALADEERRRAFVWMVGDLNLLPVFTFDTDSLVELYPGDITTDSLRGVLKSWSLAFGETKDTPLANFFLENPVTTKPLVRLSEDLYVWSNMQALAHSAQTLFEDLVAQDSGLKDSYLRRRGDFLEDSASDLMRAKFPTATVLTNMKWDYGDAEYESDVVVLVDAAVLILECKGGRLAARSRVGRAGTVRADINKLIAAPTEQAERLARLLEERKDDLVVRVDGEEITIDCSMIHRAITAGVTYEALASMLPNLGEVVEAGLTAEDVEALSFNLTLFDLRVILDILEHPSEVIHYLGRRNQLEMGQAFTGEETDLLGFYLETSFNLGEAEFGDERHQITGLSDPIDRYY